MGAVWKGPETPGALGHDLAGAEAPRRKACRLLASGGPILAPTEGTIGVLAKRGDSRGWRPRSTLGLPFPTRPAGRRSLIRERARPRGNDSVAERAASAAGSAVRTRFGPEF